MEVDEDYKRSRAQFRERDERSHESEVQEKLREDDWIF
jgi:hypothetical protein